MELRHIRYFIAVAEQGSISRAADKLFIAQPPLSQQIRMLEDEIGVPLLKRHHRGVHLTAAGSAFLVEARQILDLSERAKEVARNQDNPNGGMLRIGFVPSASHNILPSFIRQLRAVRPQIELDVREMITAEQVQMIECDRLDLGIARPPLNSKTVKSVYTIADPFCLALPEDHPLAEQAQLTLNATSRANFVSFTRHHAPAYFDQVINFCGDAGFSPRIRYQASTIYGVLDLVRAGLGVAVVPASVITLNLHAIALRPLSLCGEIALIRRSGNQDPVIEIAVDLMGEVFSTIRQQIARVTGSA